MKILIISTFAVLAFATAIRAADKPNILVILSDDQGYADAGFQGSKEIPTPHLDRLAREGVRCKQGYVSHPVCSPSRAGLLTGRYQMRFGHERNPNFTKPEEGLPADEKLLPQYLAKAGYATGWIGKWHLGHLPQFLPEKRGFRETFGFLGGGHAYIDWQPVQKSEYKSPILRNGKAVPVTEHLTLAFGREAAAFINRHKQQPWFLYLAFNAPHTPHEPTAERLRRFSHIEDKQRRAYVAQVSLLDDAVGETMKALRESGQAENTLVFFLSDNGGATFGSDNRPLRAFKGTTFEGGVRVPFVVAWPKNLPAGKIYDGTVNSLDIFATALEVAGVSMPTDKPHDGVSLIPYLKGETNGNPHDILFWRETGVGQWGVRKGMWKLVRQMQEPVQTPDGKWEYKRLKQTQTQLFNLADDIGEKNDRAAAESARLEELNAALDEWQKQAAPLAFGRPALKPLEQRSPERRTN